MINLNSTHLQGKNTQINIISIVANIHFRFNSIKIPRQDETLHAVSPKYGKSTIMDTAPNYKPDQWTTNARSSYYNPGELPKENWRGRQ